ncbi:Acyl-ACP Thioesterase (Chloroplastic) [Zostera marina]|uniref:Acyl-[acyl-carrier-protein] hydrolase n=1 Tax=Zostera marina TaxID=29655 RepID=A0A0K9PTS9_ZOSMR|nr:Acyl-ACP Thioesterase (Chloroplastic) [Zostera marina]
MDIVAASCPTMSGKALLSFGGRSERRVDVKSIKLKSLSTSGRLQVTANAQTVPKINGDKVLNSETSKTEDDGTVLSLSNSSKTFYNQLPDWSVLLAAITTIFLAAEKQWTIIDSKPKRSDMLLDSFNYGSVIQENLVFSQDFSIRSYEIGADGTTSIETLMNHLQETALNHVKSAGLLGDGFGATPEMSKRDLIWVVTKMQVQVENYPSWGDVVQVDTWAKAAGKNGMRRDWLVRDKKTGQTITQATSVWVMMNKHTRKLSKIPTEVREEIEPYFIDRLAITDEDSRKLQKVDDSRADYVRTGLTPRWSDMDVNQHVNNVKYIGWILESAPVSIPEKHELASMTLEYRRECERDSILQSLTAISTNCNTSADTVVECQHLLRLESGAEILRGRTEWRSKPIRNFGHVDQIRA